MTALDIELPARLLSSPGDTAAMAAKVVHLFNTPSTYQQIRNSLRNQIKLRFSRSGQLKAYAEVFSALH